MPACGCPTLVLRSSTCAGEFSLASSQGDAEGATTPEPLRQSGPNRRASLEKGLCPTDGESRYAVKLSGANTAGVPT